MMWSEEDPIGAIFPPLRLLSGLELGSNELARFATLTHGEGALTALRQGSRGGTIHDLLDITPEEMLSWSQTGVVQRDIMLRFLELASLVASVIQSGARTPAGEPEPTSTGSSYIPRRLLEDAGLPLPELEPERALETLGAWAATLTGGSTWGDLIRLANARQPRDVAAAWDTLLSAPIDAGFIGTPSDVFQRYASADDPRRWEVILQRIVGPGRRTLDDFGKEWGVSRERVRQIEHSVISQVRRLFTTSDDWRTVRWAAEELQIRLGAMAPLHCAKEVLAGLDRETLRVISWLAGFSPQGEFLIASGFRVPTLSDLPRMTPGSRVIDEMDLIDSICSAGVLPEFVELVLSEIKGLARVDGQLVDWTGSQMDKAVAILELRDEPQALTELFGMTGGESMTSFRNRAFDDHRIIRVTKSKVGLRSWGGTHYTSVASLMVQRLSSGPRTIDDLARELDEIYEVSRTSVAMYAHAPVFKVTGETVALRSPGDPFIARNKPHLVQGLLQVDSETLYWHVSVDSDVIRGSGRPLPPEIGTFLGLRPGEDALLLLSSFDEVPVSWPTHSFTGPNIGSLRLHAAGLNASVGDVLRLVFTKATRTLGVHLVPPAPRLESPAAHLSRLTGLPQPQCDDISALVLGLHVQHSEATAMLRKRGDEEWADAAEAVMDPTSERTHLEPT